MAANEDDGDDGSTFELRSYGRKRGRKSSLRQQALLADVLPRIALDLKQPAVIGDRDLWLEIGFGGGEHLIWQAERNAEVGLIGCEPFTDGVVKVLDAIEARKLGNISIHADDARDVLRWLPAASIARAFILFPDPWPKKRHVKRRLVNRSTLAELARVMRPGAELRITTDIGDYARTMLIALGATPQFQWTARSTADWRTRPPDWPPTRYEAKAGREGRRCVYLRFTRIGPLAISETPRDCARRPDPCPT